MFGYPLPAVPERWSTGARKSVNLLKKKSSVEGFGAVQDVVDSDTEQSAPLRGASLRHFNDFMKKHDPGLRKERIGDFAGLRRIGDETNGEALWTALTDATEINTAIRMRSLQFEIQQRIEVDDEKIAAQVTTEKGKHEMQEESQREKNNLKAESTSPGKKKKKKKKPLSEKGKQEMQESQCKEKNLKTKSTSVGKKKKKLQ